MIETVQKHFPNKPIKAVLGGFHMMAIPMLKNNISKIYTMHYTGNKAYGILKERLGNQLEYFGTGQTLEL